MRDILWLIRDYMFLIAVVLYAVLCIPSYIILEGQVGDVNSIPPQVVIGGLLVGSIIMIPLFHAILEKYAEVYIVRRAVADTVTETESVDETP